MGEHRARPEQAVVVVDVQVAAALGEQLLYPLDFLEVLRQVGVQVYAGMFA